MLSGQFRDGTLYVGNITEIRLPEPGPQSAAGGECLE
jgi:hypothetical protein